MQTFRHQEAKQSAMPDRARILASLKNAGLCRTDETTMLLSNYAGLIATKKTTPIDLVSSWEKALTDTFRGLGLNARARVDTLFNSVVRVVAPTISEDAINIKALFRKRKS